MPNFINIPNSAYYLSNRNTKAKQTITKFASRHMAMDVGIGVVGTVPGLGIPALIASIVAQVPLIYHPMIKELSVIYSSSPNEVTSSYIAQALAIDIAYQPASDILISDMGVDFMTEIIGEIISEGGIGAAIGTFIPIVGGIVAAGLDAIIASKLTWRVGTLTAMYFLYDEEWIGNRKETYNIAKKEIGTVLPGNTGNLDSAVKNEHVCRKIVQGIIDKIKTIKKYAPNLSNSQIKNDLLKEGLPHFAIERAFNLI